jgi:hypothetical protein
MSGWSDDQAKSFAKRIAERYKAAWFVLTNDLREALVSQFVLLVVLGQEKVAVEVAEVRELLQAVYRHLATRHKMMTEAAEETS